MGKPKRDYSHSPAVDRLVTKIALECLELNCNSGYAVFFNYSGHVDQLSVYVCAGKTNEDYNNRLGEFRTYLSDRKQPEIAEDLEVLLSKLRELKGDLNVLK